MLGDRQFPTQRNGMESFLLKELCDILAVTDTEVDVDKSFIQNGGDSFKAAAFVGRCKARGLYFTCATILTSPSLLHLFETTQVTMGKRLSTPHSGGPLNTNFKSQRTVSSSINQSSSQQDPLLFPNAKTAGVDTLEDQTQCILDRAQYEEMPRVVDQATDLDPSSIPGSAPLPKHKLEDIGVATEPLPSLTMDYEPLTEMQLSFVYGTLKNPWTNIITHAETYYKEDVPALKAAWKEIIEQEHIFSNAAIAEFREKDWVAFDWQETGPEVPCYHKASELQQCRGIGSFFEVIPCKCVVGHPDCYTIVWRVHHAFIDGYSASLLFERVQKRAKGLMIQAGPSFTEVMRNLRMFRGAHQGQGNAYWQSQQEQLVLAKKDLLLPPPSHQIDVEKPGRVSTAVVTVETSIHERISSTARKISVTPAAFFNAAWALVLGTYADSDLVQFGAVMSGRTIPLPNVMEVIGPLVNTLPLCVTIERSSSVEDFVRSVFQGLVQLEAFQWTTPANGFTRDFESALALQFRNPEETEATIKPIEVHPTQQDTDLALSISVCAKGKIQFCYQRSRFNQADVERIAACYHEALLLLLCTHATVDATMMALLSCPSQSLLMRYGNCLSGLTLRTSVKEDLVTLFEKAARSVPGDIAIEKGDHFITYADFDRAASRVALRLKSIISRDDVVCIHADRSINWLVGIFGVLKARGVYCPLDATLQDGLRDSIFLNSGATVYLAPSTTQLNFSPSSSKHTLSIESILEDPADPNGCPLEHRTSSEPWSVAYVCFTSGSSGKPKGVTCTHEGLVAFQTDLEVRLFAQPGRRVAQIMSVAFDGSIHELFSALTYGATLVLPSGGDPFAHLVSVHSAILTPSIARVLDPRDYEGLQTVYLVGEQVPQAVADSWGSVKQLYNMYGPTEGTGGATIKRLNPRSLVTIGKPNPTTRIYILNSRQELAQPGMMGEIYLAGVQVAKGYINLPEETKAKFLSDSICRNGEQMYRTGDWGYWNPYGEIVCLGRNDRQIKLRGYRLDLNDLEVRVAQALPEVEGVVIARQKDELVAMIQPSFISLAAIKPRIAKALPPYALPRNIILVDKFPMTAAGKVDYNAVSRASTGTPKIVLQAPKTETEKIVAKSFRYVLQLEKTVPLSIESSFIALGGHSLQQLSLARHLSRILSVVVPLKIIIQNPTIGEMAKRIDEQKAPEMSAVLQKRSLGENNLSPIEKEWMLKYTFDAGSSCFNVCFTSAFDKRVISRYRLAKAWDEVLARHKLLRSRYVAHPGKRPQRTFADGPPRAVCVQELNLWAEVNRPFQLHSQDPVRVTITEDRLLVVLSHIVADYTTLSILLKEASAIYNGTELGSDFPSYFSASSWFSQIPPCFLDFWSEYLGNHRGGSELLGSEQERTGYRGTSLVSLIPSGVLRSMLRYSNSAKATLQQLALAAVALCLDPNPFETNQVVGCPYISRGSSEEMETVGLFLEPLPVVIGYSSSQEETYLRTVQKSSQAALAHAVPWHQLLESLSIHPQYPNHPISDVMVTLHDTWRSRDLDMTIPGFDSCLVWSEGSKFKLMCEFNVISESKLLLRIEYDMNCIPEQTIRRLEAMIPHALLLLTQELPHEEIKRQIAKTESVDDGKPVTIWEFFGKKICEI